MKLPSAEEHVSETWFGRCTHGEAFTRDCRKCLAASHREFAVVVLEQAVREVKQRGYLGIEGMISALGPKEKS